MLLKKQVKTEMIKDEKGKLFTKLFSALWTAAGIVYPCLILWRSGLANPYLSFVLTVISILLALKLLIEAQDAYIMKAALERYDV